MINTVCLPVSVSMWRLAMGRVIRTSVPLFCWLLISTVAFIWVSSFFTMLKPSPIPWDLPEKKGRKSLFFFVAGMPQPLS